MGLTWLVLPPLRAYPAHSLRSCAPLSLHEGGRGCLAHSSDVADAGVDVGEG